MKMPDQVELIKLGKEVIPIELVGRNIDYRVLKDPRKPAYPKGDEVRYCDDYVSRLNEIYPLNDVLGKRKKAVAEGVTNELAALVMDSPLNNSEGERTLAYILINSAQAEMWQPFIIDVPKLTDTQIQTAREYLEKVDGINPRYNRGMIDGGILFGLAVAKRGGLALPTEYENKVIAVPSQEFIEYCSTRR